jgi:hypothetical protein
MAFSVNFGPTHPPISDALLDGVSITAKSGSAYWKDENVVHKAPILSANVVTTRHFQSTQGLAIRDDIRKISHILVPESEALYCTHMYKDKIVHKDRVSSTATLRAHICYDKYDGMVFITHIAKTSDGVELFLNGDKLDTTSKNVDFPFMLFSQAQIGHVQMTPTAFGLLTYKCRDTGQFYIRKLVNHIVQAERVLSGPAAVGGVNFAIHNNNVFFEVDAIVDNKIVPMSATSDDEGDTVSIFDPLDLTEVVPDAILPATCPAFTDYLGNYHVPISALKDGNWKCLDYMPTDSVVEALTLPPHGGSYSASAFPKAPGSLARSPLGRGDGQTDGMGIIATGLSEGNLIVSNSQAGGIYYPPSRLLNNEMPKAYTFKASQCCYTRAVEPNKVSMDYIFLETDSLGQPISHDLLLETWDMPLPLPDLSAKASGNIVNLTIVKDAWFEVGKTIFEISDPTIGIVSATVTAPREAIVEFNSDQLQGKKIQFEMKSLFYYHAGEAIIE